MSQENVEIVRRFYKCWNNHDLDGMLECVDGEVCIDWSESRGPQSGIYVGHEGVIVFRNDLLEAFDDFRVEPLDPIELDAERLVTVTEVRGRGKESRIPMQASGAVLWTVRDGRIVGGRLFQSKAEALEAVGLSE